MVGTGEIHGSSKPHFHEKTAHSARSTSWVHPGIVKRGTLQAGFVGLMGLDVAPLVPGEQGANERYSRLGVRFLSTGTHFTSGSLGPHRH